MTEIWKPIKGFEGLYEISNMGRLRSFYKATHGRFVVSNEPQKIRKANPDGNGYLGLCLKKNGKAYPKRIHRLVLITFVGDCPQGMEACHNDGIKTNNIVNNLRWDTHRNNMVIDGGARAIMQKGENNPSAKLTTETVLRIKELGRQKMLHREIGNLLSVSRRNVSRIIQGVRWAHI